MVKIPRSLRSPALAVGLLLVGVGGVYLIRHFTQLEVTTQPPTLEMNRKGSSGSRQQSNSGTPLARSKTTSPSDSSEEGASIQTIESLVASGSPGALQQIALIIRNLPPGDEREEAVRIASTITNPSAVPQSLEFLQNASDPGVIRLSQEIFARLADAASIQALLDIYDSSDSSELRDRLERTVAYIHSEEAVPVLKLVLADNETPAADGMIRASAQALRQIGTQPAVDSLIERLNYEKTDECRSLISAQFREVRNPVAELCIQSAALGQSKFATQHHTRVAAIGVLLNYPSAETQDLLASLASDPDSRVVATASEILGEIRRRLANK